MSFSNQTMPVSPEMRERLFLVSAKDLSNRVLHPVLLRGTTTPTQPKFCDVWSAANLDGVLFGDFCVDMEDTPDEARFVAFRAALGDIRGEPDPETLLAAMTHVPQTLIVVIWGEEPDGTAFAAFFHHPCLAAEDAKRWLITWIGRGPLRSGTES